MSRRPSINQLTLGVVLLFSFIANRNNKTNKQIEALETSKTVLFRNIQLFWIDLLKKNGNKTVPM